MPGWFFVDFIWDSRFSGRRIQDVIVFVLCLGSQASCCMRKVVFLSIVAVRYPVVVSFISSQCLFGSITCCSVVLKGGGSRGGLYVTQGSRILPMLPPDSLRFPKLF